MPVEFEFQFAKIKILKAITLMDAGLRSDTPVASQAVEHFLTTCSCPEATLYAFGIHSIDIKYLLSGEMNILFKITEDLDTERRYRHP